MSFTLSLPPIMSTKIEAAAPQAQPPQPPSFKLNMTPCEAVHHWASSNAVVIFTLSDCCMSTVAKSFLISLGVGPTIVELDKESDGNAIRAFLNQIAGNEQPVPAVFVGGKFVGGVETLMAKHINGTLVPLLKEVGALWL